MFFLAGQVAELQAAECVKIYKGERGEDGSAGAGQAAASDRPRRRAECPFQNFLSLLNHLDSKEVI